MIKKKILIVEDENCLLKLECILLTCKGFDVMGVADGEEALDIIFDYRPDLVPLGVMMPGMDGFEACRRLKSDRRTRHITVYRQKNPTGYSSGRGSRGGLLHYQTFQILHCH